MGPWEVMPTSVALPSGFRISMGPPLGGMREWQGGQRGEQAGGEREVSSYAFSASCAVPAPPAGTGRSRTRVAIAGVGAGPAAAQHVGEIHWAGAGRHVIQRGIPAAVAATGVSGAAAGGVGFEASRSRGRRRQSRQSVPCALCCSVGVASKVVGGEGRGRRTRQVHSGRTGGRMHA